MTTQALAQDGRFRQRRRSLLLFYLRKKILITTVKIMLIIIIEVTGKNTILLPSSLRMSPGSLPNQLISPGA